MYPRKPVFGGWERASLTLLKKRGLFKFYGRGLLPQTIVEYEREALCLCMVVMLKMIKSMIFNIENTGLGTV